MFYAKGGPRHIPAFLAAFKIISHRISSAVGLIRAPAAGNCRFDAGSGSYFPQLCAAKNVRESSLIDITQTKMPVAHAGKHPGLVGWKN